jgi:non-specific serine/threonine protein kinase
MLETIRAYALERLTAGDEEAAVRTRHAAWCLDLAERFWTALGGEVEDPRWLPRVEVEHDNVRAALAWLDRSDDGVGMLRLAGAIGRLWEMHSHRAEGIDWLERALVRGRQAPPAIRLRALTYLGVHLERQGHAQRARVRHQEQLALARDLGDPLQTVQALGMLGMVATNQGRYDEATPLTEEAVALAQRLGSSFMENWWTYLLGIIAYGQDDVAAASAHVEAAVAGWRASGQSVRLLAVALNAAALLSFEQGDETKAAALLAESLPRWQEIGEKEGQTEWLAAVARLAACRGRLEPAARLYGAAEAASDALGSPLRVPPPARYRRHVAALRDAMGGEAFAAAWSAGRALPLDQAVAEASAGEATTGEAGTGADPHGLTPRELEVLRLLSAGHSNRAIADALTVSLATAKGHVANILDKLGADSRTAAVAHAHRHGLV